MKIKCIKIFFTVIVVAIVSSSYGNDNKNNIKQTVAVDQNLVTVKSAVGVQNQEDIRKILSFSQYVKKIDDFTFLSNDKKTQEHGVYFLNFELGTKYLIKEVNPKQVYADFIGAFILRKIIGDRAPLNYIVCDNDGKVIGLASRLIENFISLYDYVQNGEIISNPRFLKKADEFGGKLIYLLAGTVADDISSRCKNIEEICEELCYSDLLVEANLLANFIGQQDYHHRNLGFIIKNGTVVNSALVDFDCSLGFYSPWEVLIPSNRYFGGAEKALKSLNLISKFKVSYLDELNDLFDILDERAELNRVKALIQNNLKNIGLQINACYLFIKVIIKTSVQDQDILELINIGLKPAMQGNGIILMNFTSKTGNNDLINILCQKNDIDNLVKILSSDNSIAEAFINYCLASNSYDLLKTVSFKLDNNKANNLVKKILDASKTTEHLIVYLNLVKNREIQLDDHEVEQLKQKALQNRTIDNLAAFLNLLKEVGSATIYIQNNLEDINRHIRACELLTKITTQSYTQEEFEELIALAKNKPVRREKNFHSYTQSDESILSKFTFENGKNILINFLCQKEDVDNMIIVLGIDKQLVASCIKYCLEYKPDFFKKIVLRLDDTEIRNLILETLKNCKTVDCLQMAEDLIIKINMEDDYIKLIENFLNKKLTGNDIIEKLCERLTNPDRYPDDKDKYEAKGYGVKIWEYGIYTQLLDTLVTMWLSQDNVTPLRIKPEKILNGKIYTFMKRIAYKLISDDDFNKLEKYLVWVSQNDELTKNVCYTMLSEKKWELFKKLYGAHDKTEIKKIIDDYIRAYPYKESEEGWVLYSLFNIRI